MTILQVPFFQNTPSGQIIYNVPGTYTFVVPDDVYSLSAVCIGGGGSSARGQNAREQSGAGGGGLRYINNLPVTPGETLTVVVGSGGAAVATNNVDGVNGGNSLIQRGANVLVQANGGTASLYVNGASTGGAGGTGTATGAGPFGGTIGGGNGGKGGDSAANNNAGGGGAGGYSGNGGPGVNDGGTFAAGNQGAGGGGAGGEDGPDDGVCGGGVGLLGESASGTTSGAGGSGGENGTSGVGSSGGLYGGGGGGAEAATQGAGGGGATRIIWGPNRNFPANRTTDIFTGSTLLYDASFASSNATTNGSITVPSIASGDLYLFIVYENDTVNRPTISGFEIIRSDNGTFDNAACTRVLLKGKATPGSTVTIPNDATYNGFVASLIGFTNGTNVGQTRFQAGIADASFSITNGYFIMMANHDGLTEAYDTYSLDADFTRTFTYLTANGAVTGRAAAIGVVEPVVQSGTITPSRPAVGATVQTQGTQFCFLYIN